MLNITPFTVFRNITTHLLHVTTSLPCGHVLRPRCVTWLPGCSANAWKLFSFCLFNLIQCWSWTVFLATILIIMKNGKIYIKNYPDIWQSNKTLASDAVTYHSAWGKVSAKEKVSSLLNCLRMLVMKHFNTRNIRSRDISEPLSQKNKKTLW